jgi:hypothetical protein
MTPLQFILGLGSLAVFAVTIHKREKLWLAPSAVFLAFYASATLFAPWYRMRFDGLQEYNLDFFPKATTYSLAALWAMWIGYLLVPCRDPEEEPLAPMLSDGVYHLLRALLIGLFALRVWVMVASGSFFEAKGEGTYDAGLLRWAGHCTTMIYPIFLLVFADVFVRRWQGVRANVLFLAFFGVFVLLISMATFSRQAFLWAGMYAFLFYHSRKGFTRRQLSLAALVVVLVCVCAGLKALDTGIARMTANDAYARLEDSLGDIDRMASSIAGSVAGQEVFTNVLAHVPDCEDYAYGRTYWDSLVGLLTPRFLTGRFEEEEISTPATWYKDWHAPNVTGHGFDFSMLAEAYMNFGGGLIVFFVGVGALVAHLSRTIRCSPSTLHVCIGIVVLTALCFGLRNDSNTILKAVLYFSLFMWCLAGRSSVSCTTPEHGVAGA